MSDAVSNDLLDEAILLHQSMANTTEATCAEGTPSDKGFQLADSDPADAADPDADNAQILSELNAQVAAILAGDQSNDPRAKLKGKIAGKASYKNLAAHLLMTPNDLRAWTESKLFQPYFKRLYENYIKPSQDASQGKARLAGPQLSAVEASIKYEDMVGREKYTDELGDTDSFTSTDWLARFVVTCRERNIRNRDGIFFKKNMDNASMNQRLWMAYRICSDEVSPSKAVKPGAMRLINPPVKSTVSAAVINMPSMQVTGLSTSSPTDSKTFTGDIAASSVDLTSSTTVTASSSTDLMNVTGVTAPSMNTSAFTSGGSKPRYRATKPPVNLQHLLATVGSRRKRKRMFETAAPRKAAASSTTPTSSTSIETTANTSALSAQASNSRPQAPRPSSSPADVSQTLSRNKSPA